MNGKYLTDYPIDGYLHGRRSERLALRRDRFSLRPLMASIGWVLAGATVGSVAVMLGAWGLLQLTERPPVMPGLQTTTAMTYQAPASLPK
jgi:hypothetical protein